MGRFNGPTVKHHKTWSNDKGLLDVLHLRAGKMNRSQREQKNVKLVKKYFDKEGVRRHSGLKEALRESQNLVCISS